MSLADKKPLICALAVPVLLGGCAPFTKILLEGIEPVILASLLYLGSGVGLVCYRGAAWLTGRRRDQIEAKLERSDVPWLLGAILTGGIIAPVLMMLSLAQTPAATAALLLNFEAVGTTMVAAFLFGEYIGNRIWLAVTCIIASCLLVSYDPGGLFIFSLPALGIIATCTFWSLENNLNQKIAGKDPIRIVTLKGLIAGSATFCIAMAVGETLPAPMVCLTAMAFGFISFGGLMSVLFLIGIRGIGTARTGSLLAVAPFFGIVISLLIFSDRPGILFDIAVPIMAVGVWLLLTEKHTHLHEHQRRVHEHRHRHDDSHHEHEHNGKEPPLSPSGEHSHLHIHEEVIHDHPHRPDIHHRHGHRLKKSKK